MVAGDAGGSVAAARGHLARIWSSPSDQPRWARPALLAIASVAALSYSWRFGSARLEPFYGAAARSMSSSWHDFFFGAFDPAGTVTIDKLPGALWLQALSLRLFGFHVWAMVLPQVLEGVVTILVLYRAVRRLAGPVAAITAALLLALSPITIALNRGNVSDSLLIMLTVLAADATSAALLNGRLRSLLLAGVWVGLAFQAKMLQAWLVLPALAITYLIAGVGRPRQRIVYLSLAGLVTVAVSVSWMSVVSLIPAHARPYVDGSLNDSPFSQVFIYNGLAHLSLFKLSGLVQPAPFIAQELRDYTLPGVSPAGVPASWHRLLAGFYARDVGWLYPAAAIALVGVLLACRGAGRETPERACVVLWGLWLIVLLVFFSEGTVLNSYYVAALAPAIAALCGTGVGVAAKRWGDSRVRACVATAVLATVGYGDCLLIGATEVPVWLIPLAACLGVLGTALVLAVRFKPRRSSVLSLAVACALVTPTVASALVVADRLGPLNAPFEPAPPPTTSSAYPQLRAVLSQLSSTYPAQIPLGVYSSGLAAPWILASGEEVLPIGGYLGGLPVPTLAELRRDIASGRLRTFLIPLAPANDDPRILWLLSHCQRFSGPSPEAPRPALYHC